MSNYNKIKHNLKFRRAGELGRFALRAARVLGTPYLTRTNNSTTTSVNFETFLYGLDILSDSLSRLIKSTKKWLAREVVYE